MSGLPCKLNQCIFFSLKTLQMYLNDSQGNDNGFQISHYIAIWGSKMSDKVEKGCVMKLVNSCGGV